MPQFITTLTSLAPVAFAVAGVLLAFLTALHVALLALSALPFGAFSTWCGKAASVVGVVSIDLQKVVVFVKKIDAPIVTGVVFLIALICCAGCTQAQSAQDVKVACGVFESSIATEIADLVNLTGLPATSILDGIDAECLAGGVDAARTELGRLQTVAAASALKATGRMPAADAGER
jgi:hypothetical protein